MKALLMKDFMIMENQKRFFFGILFLSMILIGIGQGTFAISFTTMILTMFTISTIAYDEYDNGYAFLMTLPFSRKQYVFSKYLFGLIAGLITGCLMIGLNGLCSMVFHLEFDLAILSLTLASVLASVLLLLSVYIPMILKFGSESSRLAIVGFVGVLFLLGMGLNFLGVSMDAVFQTLITMDPIVFGCFVAMVILLAYGISYKVSVKIFMNRSF